MTNDDTLKPFLYLMLVAFAGGSLSVLSKFALASIPVFGLVATRYVICLILLYLVLRMRGKRVPWRKFRPFMPIAILWILSAFAFMFGLQRTNATTAQFIHTGIPVATALFAGYILHQKLRGRQWAGIALALAGVTAIILSKGRLTFDDTSLVGNLLVLLSLFGYAAYAVLTKLSRYHRIDAVEMVFICISYGLAISLPLAAAELRADNWVSSVGTSAWLATVFGAIAMAVFATGFQALNKLIGPAYAALSQYLNPLFVILWAAVLLDERPEVEALFGAAVALTGVWLVTSATRSRAGSTDKPVIAD